MASPAIELRQVNIEFGGNQLRRRSDRQQHTMLDSLPGKKWRKPVLQNINFKVEHGEVVVVMGPSGAGKSVLLKLMAGLMNPTSGSVLIEGNDWRTMQGSERAQIALKTGMLFQKNALFDSMTAAENVAFPLSEVARVPMAEVEKTVAFYLEAVGLTAARDRYPDEISGGMQKRLGIARALAMKPKIVFYDDPTAGLDPITSRKIIQLIVDLHKDMKTTVVAVTNDVNRAFQMADRIAMAVGAELIDCGDASTTRASVDPRVQQFITGALTGPLTRPWVARK